MTLNTQYSNYLDRFVLRLLVNNEVVKMTCPSGGRKFDSRHAKAFVFEISTSAGERTVPVWAGELLLASEESKESVWALPLVLLRAAKDALAAHKEPEMISTGNFKSFAEDALASETDEELRGAIIAYLRKRYEVNFEVPFTVVELLTAIQSTPERIVRQLHYLHKHEMIGFAWPSQLWEKRGTIEEWLTESFTISKKNDDNLQLASQKGNYPQLGPASAERNVEWDFFICHASEDKAEVVQPLAEELKRKGARVWYDLWTLRMGDSLRGKIDQGLAKSRFGIVVLSRHFFGKDWPERELSGLVQKEVDREKVILPIWHNVDRDYIASQSLTLADKFAVSTDKGIPYVASMILKEASIVSKLAAKNPPIPQLPDIAKVSVGFAKLQIGYPEHIYSLVVTVALNVPPDQGRLRLKLRWPATVPVVKTSDLKEEKRVINDGVVPSREYILDWEGRLFPGEAVELLGQHSGHRLEYKFDDSVLSEIDRHLLHLKYTVFFEDHPPIHGSKPFRELNVF